MQYAVLVSAPFSQLVTGLKLSAAPDCKGKMVRYSGRHCLAPKNGCKLPPQTPAGRAITDAAPVIHLGRWRSICRPTPWPLSLQPLPEPPRTVAPRPPTRPPAAPTPSRRAPLRLRHLVRHRATAGLRRLASCLHPPRIALAVGSSPPREKGTNEKKAKHVVYGRDKIGIDGKRK
jgi:hypothetical protein